MRAPAPGDEGAFLEAVRLSRGLHHPWISAPATPEAFRAWVGRGLDDSYVPHLIVTAAGGEPVGVVNASAIVRGVFQSAYLGYYAFAPRAGQGLMREGFILVLRELFGWHRLHRVEANIQPGNVRSRALVESLGFRREGYSPRYLKIAGRWRDHERWALLAEELRARP